ncbi:hypothetical protein CYMTET_13254 [Cymbomonas tetramitiformis]|uniref:Uncharacterized protein n=1 Tax=Cymbomonas tetramitiformis TaxID=36881 RepID=A0AAE0GII2_9CHLO|nr:hypothetical protein CYMTET_13254 [Cymbomonas tetramitiformis]
MLQRGDLLTPDRRGGSELLSRPSGWDTVMSRLRGNVHAAAGRPAHPRQAGQVRVALEALRVGHRDVSHFSLVHELLEALWVGRCNISHPGPPVSYFLQECRKRSPPVARHKVGMRLEVYWKDDDAWYPGSITGVSDIMRHVAHDGGEEEDQIRPLLRWGTVAEGGLKPYLSAIYNYHEDLGFNGPAKDRVVVRMLKGMAPLQAQVLAEAGQQETERTWLRAEAVTRSHDEVLGRCCSVD